jgi:hypothetical protein
MVASFKLAPQSRFIFQNRTSITLILKEVVVIVTLVSHLLVKRNVEANYLFATFGLLCSQVYVKLILYHLKLSEPFTRLLYFLLPLLP